jgi:predicted phage terminase large subunit-like protein
MTEAAHAEESLSPEEFLIACRRVPSFFQQFVGNVENGQLQEDLQAFWSSPEGANSYTELPRGHSKTATLGLRLAWEIGSNPNIRIKYVGSNEAEAGKTVTMVKRIMEGDEFQMVFPEIRRDKDNWGNTALTVQRPNASLRDPTIEAVPVLGRAGGRSDLLVFDDICDMRNAIMQPSSREQVKDFVKNNWLPTRDRTNLENPPRTWRIGTPYHVADITADWRRYHGERGSLFRRPVVDFVSPWPERWSVEAMREIREEFGAFAYARAYELVPVSTDQIVFRSSWLDQGFWWEMPDHVRSTGTPVGSIDFAFNKKSSDKPNPDYSVLIAGRRSMQGDAWVERMLRVRESFPEFKRQAASLCMSMGIRDVFCEASGPQRGLVQQMQTEYPSIRWHMVERSADKMTRATEQQTFVEQGRLRMRSDRDLREPIEELRPLYDELSTFPASEHDDCVDAAVTFMSSVGRGGYGADHRPTTVSSGKGRLWRLKYG